MKESPMEDLLDYREMAGIPTNVIVPERFKQMLRYLSNRTRIRQSEYLREAVRDLLIKYREEFKGSDYQF